MNLTIERHKDIAYHYIATRQFKTVQITLRFFDELEEKSATVRHLMLSMLKAKNRLHPSRKALTRKLEELYDTSLSGVSLKLGNKHINQFGVNIVNPSFIDDPRFFEDVLEILRATLFNPRFDEKTLEEEKQFLKDYFKAEYANKARYAAKRYRDHLFAGHPNRINPLGAMEHIDAITLEEVEKAYERMIGQNSLLVSVVGDFDEERVHRRLRAALPFETNAPLPDDFFLRSAFEKKEPITETMPLAQDRLFMTLSSGVFYGDEGYFTMVVLTALLGEGGDSLLFRRVREEKSLAYYVHAQYRPFSALVSIHSAMKKKNVEQAKALIEETLEDIKAGNFKKRSLDLAKQYLITSIKQSFDSPRSLSLIALRHQLLSMPFDESYMLKKIRDVSKTDVMETAKRLRWIFTYVLGSEDDEKDAI